MALLVALCGVAQAEVLTFENGDHGVSVGNDMAITTQYLASAEVTFHTGTGTNYGAYSGSAYIEQMGLQAGEAVKQTTGNAGFAYQGNIIDTVASGTGRVYEFSPTKRPHGKLFPSHDQFFSTKPYCPVWNGGFSRQFSNWDIDGGIQGTEKWTIKAYSGDWSTQVITESTPEMFDSGLMTSFDGQAYVVSLSGATYDRFVIEFTGTKSSNPSNPVGLAFNDFNTTQIPEPASIGMIALGGLLIAGYRRFFGRH